MEKFDPKIYHVDRHDHVSQLDENVDFISYYDIRANDVDFELKEKYFREEDRLINFLIDILLDGRSESELSLKGNSSHDVTRDEIKTLDKKHIKILKNFNSFDREFKLDQKTDLKLLLSLAFRERIEIKVKFDRMIFSSGYDLCMYFQNIDLEYLKRFVEKHKLHIVGNWYHNIWVD